MTAGIRVTRRTTAVTLLTALLASLVALLAPTPADAHSALRRVAPTDGAVVEHVPGLVRFDFDEPMSLGTGDVRIVAPDGQDLDLGPVIRRSSRTYTVQPLSDGGPGSYVVNWQGVSADGHPLRGATTFAVGAASPIATGAVDAGAGPIVTVGARAARFTAYLGLFVASGAALFAVVVGRRRDDLIRTAVLARRAAWVAVGGALGLLLLNAAEVSDAGWSLLTDLTVLGAALTSPVGQTAVIVIVGACVLIVAAPAVARGRSLVAAVAGAAALSAFAIEGHSATTEPAWLAISADIAHLLAGATWTGGLAAFLLVLRSRRREDDALGAARIVRRFSMLATVSVVAVTLAGTTLGVLELGSFAAFVTTTYGLVLLAKLAATLPLYGLGAYNHWRLVPAVEAAVPVPAGGSVDTLPATAHDPATGLHGAQPLTAEAGDAAWAALRRSVRFELLAIVVVLALTSVLVNLARPVDAPQPAVVSATVPLTLG